MTDQSPSLSVNEHRAAAREQVRCAVLTLSDTRTQEMDASGAFIRQAPDWADFDVVDYQVKPDDPDTIRTLLSSWAERDDIDAILTNGEPASHGGIRPTTQSLVYSTNAW